MTPQQKLVQLYSTSSKHSNYQVLSSELQKLVGDKSIETKSRSEKERFDFVNDQVSLAGASIIDVGANTGYFTFEAIKSGAIHAMVFEGNHEHAEFVKVAAEALAVQDKVVVKNEYYQFNKLQNDLCDVMFLFNVLHHVGDDYGDKTITIHEAKEQMLTQLNYASSIAQVAVFQLGYNWQGNPKYPLFKNGTKAEVIDYLKAGTKDHWEITSIGIATKRNDTVIYQEPNPTNIQRDNSLGEFLNRPIFILKSKG